MNDLTGFYQFIHFKMIDKFKTLSYWEEDLMTAMEGLIGTN